MAAMRVAIAGTNALSIRIAHTIQERTNYQFVMLSRVGRPQLIERGFPVLTVDYNDVNILRHALLGVDVVISTVAGEPQINLIHAAVAAGVSRFAPAEYGSTLNPENAQNDPLDRGRTLALSWLLHYKNSHSIEFCMFVCGVLYERFDQGGVLRHALGLNTLASGEGEYLVNVRQMSVEAPLRNDEGDEVHVCLTAMQDVAAYVVEALSMTTWPTTMTMYSERLTVGQIIRRVEEMRGIPMQNVTEHDMESLLNEIQLAGMMNNQARRQRAINHLATAAGRFDFTSPTLNRRFPNVQRTRFRDWLAHSWAGV